MYSASGIPSERDLLAPKPKPGAAQIEVINLSSLSKYSKWPLVHKPIGPQQRWESSESMTQFIFCALNDVPHAGMGKSIHLSLASE